MKLLGFVEPSILSISIKKIQRSISFNGARLKILQTTKNQTMIFPEKQSLIDYSAKPRSELNFKVIFGFLMGRRVEPHRFQSKFVPKKNQRHTIVVNF